MANMSFFEADDDVAKFRLAQPLRHLTTQHAALRFSAYFSLAGDDEYEGQAIAMGTVQKSR